MTDPSGYMWAMPLRIRDIISEVSAFQTWVGVETAAAALAYIHMFETRESTDLAQAKYAVIMPAPFTLNRIATGVGLAAYDWQRSVTFGVVWTAQHSAETCTVFLNSVGSIFSGIIGHEDAARFRTVQGLSDERHPLRWQSDNATEGYQQYFTVEDQN